MVLRADPSRSSLDGWDELVQLLQVAAVGLTVVIALVYALAGVALRPFTRLVDGLRRVGHGDFDIRLALPRGVEARAVTEAFNRMVQSVRDSVAATAAAAEARARLDDNLALTRIIQQRIEEERRSIARELHDELGQQITAIKSMGLVIAQRSAPLDPTVAQTARLVVDTATRMYDGVHRMIVQLRPLALDDSALGDALEEMIAEWRARRPQIEFGLQLDALPDELPDAVSTTAYRVVQEALTNAVRHADGASSIAVNLRGDGERLEIRVADDGPGLADDWDRRGRLGLVGLRERVTALGGTFDIVTAAQRGAEIAVCLPVRPLPAGASPGE
jgi:two-component system sensor histidine kinase UhpB